jgi:hypothetical protein
MAPLNDEQAGEILARYVEALKNADDPGTVNFVAITAAETDELAPVMKTAAQVAEALAEERSGDAAKEAARRKFRDRAATLAREAAAAQEAVRQPASAPAGGGAPRGMLGWLRFPQLVGGLGWACALLLGVLLLVPRPAQRATSPSLPLSHAEVHQAVGDLIQNRVPLDRTRLMWAHLVGCDACFSVYQKQWRQFHGMAAFPPELARWRETHHAAHIPPAGGMGAVFDGH